MRACLTILFVLSVLLALLAGEVRAELCAQMNQEVVRGNLVPLPGSNLAVATGVLQTSGRIVGAALVLLPVSGFAEVTATIYPATQAGELSFLRFSVNLATGAGTGTFSKLSGFVDTLTFQAIPCP